MDTILAPFLSIIAIVSSLGSLMYVVFIVIGMVSMFNLVQVFSNRDDNQRENQNKKIPFYFLGSALGLGAFASTSVVQNTVFGFGDDNKGNEFQAGETFGWTTEGLNGSSDSNSSGSGGSSSGGSSSGGSSSGDSSSGGSDSGAPSGDANGSDSSPQEDTRTDSERAADEAQDELDRIGEERAEAEAEYNAAYEAWKKNCEPSMWLFGCSKDSFEDQIRMEEEAAADAGEDYERPGSGAPSDEELKAAEDAAKAAEAAAEAELKQYNADRSQAETDYKNKIKNELAPAQKAEESAAKADRSQADKDVEASYAAEDAARFASCEASAPSGSSSSVRNYCNNQLAAYRGGAEVRKNEELRDNENAMNSRISQSKENLTKSSQALEDGWNKQWPPRS
ncbi:hypothetical protein VCHA53O466_140065 [Vibrio chagasii]|nr:hypothetical protein VCHA53O466_140065 [Vibrio chagasii]